MIVSLIGYRATGKTTIGLRLATILKIPSFDSDRLITEKTHKTIANIFAQEGEIRFRETESEIVSELMKIPAGVISWGGGVILEEINRHEIKKSSKTIWLQASSRNIHERMTGDQQSQQNRPALTNLDPIDEIESNLNARNFLYQECADLIIQTDKKSVEEITQLVLDDLNH